MESKGVHAPNPEEATFKASRVEVYGCKDCGAQTRFPRYNDAGKLLETRNVSELLRSNFVFMWLLDLSLIHI